MSKLTKKQLIKQSEKSGKLTNLALQILFDGFNETFFNGRLNPGIKVKYVSGSRLRNANKHTEADAGWRPKTREIWIDKKYAGSECITCILLLHEMAHAVLEGTYIGHPDKNPGHGMIFQAEIHRLFHAGAYDGLL